MVGSSEATTAPTPMKNDCVAKPVVYCSPGSLSPTNARKRLHTDVDAGIHYPQHSAPAIQSAGELGMMMRAAEASSAPTRKNGRRRPQRGLQVRSEKIANHRLHE